MNDIFFSIILFICSLFVIFLSKLIMYKIFKCKHYRKNLYFSTAIITFILFGLYLLLTYIISKGSGFELADNLSSFSLVYLVTLIISIVINFISERNLYKNNKYIYCKKTKKKK